MLDKLIAEVRKIAAERPDTIYAHDGCEYDSKECSDGTIGCLLGQGLTAIGWYILEEADGRAITEVLENAGYLEEDDKVQWCAKVQREQDWGASWGSAVQGAGELFDIGSE